MKAEEFDYYTKQLRITLQSAVEVMGLITAWHDGRFQVRDDWSDKVEFVVLDVAEARERKVDRYCILSDRDHIAELMESVHQDTIAQTEAGRTKSEALENLCVLVWSACERWNRGELLSARQYLDGFAVNQLLSLLSNSESLENGKDTPDPRRRLELRSPMLAAEVLEILACPIPEGALHLLQIAEP